jgi:hypothetical protein
VQVDIAVLHDPFAQRKEDRAVDSKYFVTVIAPDRTALLRLASYDLDLLHQTAAVTEHRTVRLAAARDRTAVNEYVEAKPAQVARQATIDGLLTLEQVGRLVRDGYQVVVREEAGKRARASQVMEFQDWLKAVLEG